MPSRTAEQKSETLVAIVRKTRYPLSMTESEPRKLLVWVQKQAGVSRRKAQELIESGEVSVNRRVVSDPWLTLDISQIDHLALRGHPLSPDDPEPRIYRFHKPAKMLCSHDDPFYGNTVGRVLRAEGFIGYTWIGRLDQDSEGLLLLTNAGDLVHRFTHPRYEIEKTYHVWLQRAPSPAQATSIFREMRGGIVDQGDRLRIVEGKMQGRDGHAVVRLTEGKKHEVKRLFAHYDLHVTRLLRVAIGPVRLDRLPPGAIERLPAEKTAEILSSIR